MSYKALVTGFTAMAIGLTNAHALTSLSDNELSDQTGQALLNLSTISPTQNGNPNNGVGFYKVGLQADLEINANIRKAQLGCGGVNGSNGCDIDLDYLRLTGLEAINANGSPNNAQAPLSDFLLQNPFIELAINNPNDLLNREVVGMRVGSEGALGVLGIGTRPVDANNNPVNFKTNPGEETSTDRADVHTGINSISGVYDHLLVRGDATVVVPTAGTQQGALDESFEDVFSARADALRLKPINVKNLEAIFGIPVRPTDADFINDNRFFHNIKVSNNGEAAKGFYFSLSSMGNNDVWVKTNGNRTIERQDDINDNVVNKPNPDFTPVAYQYSTTVAEGNQDDNGDREPQYTLTTDGPQDNVTPPQIIVDRDGNRANNWLAWYTFDGLSGDREWEAANRGWSIRLPVVEVSNFTTSPVQGEISTLFTGYAQIDDSDLGQVPPSNCFGSLNFC